MHVSILLLSSTVFLGSYYEDRPVDWSKLRSGIAREEYFLKAADQIDTPKFKYDSGALIAKQWIDLRRATQQKGVEQKTERVKIKSPEVQFFLGYLEGRLDCQLPAWWKTAFIDSTYQSGFLMGGMKDVQPFEIKSKGLLINKGYEVKEAGKKIVLFCKSHELTIDQNLLDFAKKFSEADTLYCFESQKHFAILVYSRSEGPSCMLAKIRKSDGIVIWKTNVWGLSAMFSGNRHTVTVSESKSNFIVFGQNIGSFYIEVFRKSDGMCLVRFSTTY